MNELDRYLIGFAHREAGTQPAPPLVDFAKRAITGLAGDDAIIEQMASAMRDELPLSMNQSLTCVRAALRVLGEPR